MRRWSHFTRGQQKTKTRFGRTYLLNRTAAYIYSSYTQVGFFPRIYQGQQNYRAEKYHIGRMSHPTMVLQQKVPEFLT